MRYHIKRWYDKDKIHPADIELEGCNHLEVVKQVIEAIDNGQNFEARVIAPVNVAGDTVQVERVKA